MKWNQQKPEKKESKKTERRKNITAEEKGGQIEQERKMPKRECADLAIFSGRMSPKAFLLLIECGCVSVGECVHVCGCGCVQVVRV